MSLQDWFRPPRSLLTLYVSGAVLALGSVAWLALRQLDQDDIVNARLTEDRLQNAARDAALESARALADLAEIARRGDGLPPHTYLVQIREGAPDVIAGALPFLPVEPRTTPVPSGTFDAPEHLEQIVEDRAGAAAMYRSLATSPNRAISAGALLRLARAELQSQPQEALDAWTNLAAFTDVVVDGRPADLIAALGRLRALDALGRADDVRRDARSAVSDLAGGRWKITRSVWLAAREDAGRWDESALKDSGVSDRMAAAEALAAYWPTYVTSETTEPVAIDTTGGLALVMRADPSPTNDRLVIAGPAYVASLAERLAPAGMSVELVSPGSHHDPSAPGTAGIRSTQLPWVSVASELDPSIGLTDSRRRRTVFLVTLGLAAALILMSGYFTFRGIRRELAMAQLQSDFVAAVSHEFRTPLTSIRQLSHLLHDGRVDGADRRHEYYSVLVRESERLHRLVERLLSFGRADAGRFTFADVDAGELARAVVDDFRSHAGTTAIDLSVSAKPCPLHIDREMLALALWNLLDNAVKYSPDRQPVRVAVEPRNGQVLIAVQDQGAGIAEDDQRHIFGKFVRGSGAHVRDTTGSGLGLSLVDRVVRAHGGTVRVASRTGHGSTFTMVIPMNAEHAA